MTNPFILEPHVPKELFCDRDEEQKLMLYYLQNNANITLVSPRRYGKTGLIYRVFDEIKTMQKIYVYNYSENFQK